MTSEFFLRNLRSILLLDVLPIVSAFVVAYLVRRSSKTIASWIINTRTRLPRRAVSDARRLTLINLTANTFTVIALFVAIFITLAQFISVDTLVWMIGLFGAGIGFSVRPFISDYLSGIMFITADPFDVGEKVEILGVEGIVENITLRTVTIRGVDGEEYTIPNGEIRVVRNFSRGQFTPVKVTVRIASADLKRVVNLLEEFGQTEAMNQLPNLLEPWRVITESGTMGQNTELTLIAKAEFGHGAEMRPRMLALIQNHLEAEGIKLEN